MADYRAMAEAISEEIIEFRRDLHRHPEESMKEFRTTDRICEELDKEGIPYRRLDPTGVVADIVGTKPGKIVALRSDIDALSVTEKTGLPYASENPGVMHACGHDVHASILLAAGKILNKTKDELCGTVRLVFQPAEEIAQGARAVIDQGALEGVSMAFGVHNNPNCAPGYIFAGSGPVSAATDKFVIKITGTSSHGAVPQAGVDATVVAAAIIMNLQTMVSREFDPMKPLVVTVGYVRSGSRWNVISGEAVLEGTIRSADREMWAKIPEVTERIAKETAAAYRATAEVSFERLTSVLVNDEKATEIALGALEKIFEKDHILKQELQMGGEDFAEFTNVVPSTYFQLGAGGGIPWHSDYYNPEESSIAIGAAVYAQVAVEMLEKA